jgi:uncharacterized protein
MMPATLGATLSVTVAYAAPDVEALVTVKLRAGATVNDAIAQSGIVARLALDPARLEYAIFGQRAKGETPLEEGDRVELTRPLVADPKLIRRKRAVDPSGPKSGPRTGPRR